MENWDDYRLILALYRGKTLRAAAQVLHLNHSTVARRVATLNQKFGMAVFINNAQGYCLTALGEQLLNSAQQMEILTQQGLRAQRAAHIEHQQQVTLSVPPAIYQFILLNPLKEFSQQHPDIALNVKTSYQLANLDTCEADIVIRAANEPDEHLVGRRISTIATSFYGHQDYLKETKEDDYQWITSISSTLIPDWIANSPYPNAKIALKIEDLVLRHYASQQKQGIIRGACYIAEQLPDLVRLKNSPIQPFQDVWLLTHPDLKQVSKIKVLMEFLADVLISHKSLLTGKS